MKVLIARCSRCRSELARSRPMTDQEVFCQREVNGHGQWAAGYSCEPCTKGYDDEPGMNSPPVVYVDEVEFLRHNGGKEST